MQRGVIFTNENDELAFEVEFMTCIIDKADNLLVLDSDSHFSDFVGVHPSKIKQGKLYLLDLLMPKEREMVMQHLCKKNAQYVYFDFNIKNKNGKYIFVQCTGHNEQESSICHLTIADISRSEEKSLELKARANEMHHLIDLVTGGVCLFKVNQNMHFEALYMNNACCEIFGTAKDSYRNNTYRLDELIHPDDKSETFQSIGLSMATKKPIDMNLRIKKHKDDYIWCKMNSAIQRYDTDNCPIFHAIFTNINEVKEDEEEADRQTDIMVSLFKNLPGPIFYTDLETPFKLNIVSSDFMKLIGYTRKEFFEGLDGDLTKLILDRDVPIATHAVQSQAETKKTTTVSYSLKTKKGKYLVVVENRKIVDDKNGKESTMGILRDVTAMHTDEDFDF